MSADRLKWTHTDRTFKAEGIGLERGTVDLAPRKAYEDDAGFDLTTSEWTLVHPGEFADIPCGIRVELPRGAFGLILGRSSTLRDRKLMVQPGVIDAGWRGPVFVAVWNLGEIAEVIHPGERVGQLLVLPTVAARVAWVPELSAHPRGVSGFGSTGR